MKFLLKVREYLKKQFLKLVNLKKTQAPSPQAVVVPTSVVSKPAVVKDENPPNPYVGYLAKYGDDLWAVMKGENISINQDGYNLALLANFSKNQAFEDTYLRGRPVEPANPDRYRTNIVYGVDNGKVFKAPPGTTVYSTIIPPGNEYLLVFNMALDGKEYPDKHATLQVDGGPVLDVSGEQGPVAVVGDPGGHTFTVTCNHEWSVEIGFRTK